jgi:hypothetical protein
VGGGGYMGGDGGCRDALHLFPVFILLSFPHSQAVKIDSELLCFCFSRLFPPSLFHFLFLCRLSPCLTHIRRRETGEGGGEDANYCPVSA